MTSRIGTIDVDRVWDRYIALMNRTNRADVNEFELHPGDPDAEVRIPWTIKDGRGVTILTLGYTKRDAYDALLVASSTLAIAFGA